MKRFVVFAVGLVLGLASAAAAQSRVRQSFDSNGVAISYVDSGRGVPVVLIHGFTGSASRHFEGTGVMDALEKSGYRVIAMDCRGHGQSGKPLDSPQYGLEMVRDVIRLLDHLKIDRAHVVGYSMGGGVAEQVLVNYPTRALTVTLLGSGWEGEHLPELTAQLNALADGFDRGDASALIRGVFTSAQGGPSDAEVKAASADLFSRNDPKLLAAIARTLPKLWDVSRDQLRAVRVPVLAIDGDLDRNNLEAARRMVGVVAGLQLVELPGANHATSVRPSAAHIVAFLDKHRAEPAR
jgi:pimeloyl-ACP methyl ester carboxylesterase